MARLLAEDLVRDVQDFPKPGILFKDITPVVQDYAALKEVSDHAGGMGAGQRALRPLSESRREALFSERSDCAGTRRRVCAAAQTRQTARQCDFGGVRAGVWNQHGGNARRLAEIRAEGHHH